MTTISIAMTTYNGSQFIREQLQSFVNQTRLPDELVVGDDRSTDNTVEIIRDFAQSAPFPVRVIVNEKNLGYRENFLQTALSCSSDYIAFSDQDDVWLPQKLAICLDLLEKNNAILCVHTATLVSSDLQPYDSFRQGISADRVIPALSSPLFYTYYGLCQVFRRDILEIIPVECRPEGHDPLGEKISHDRWVTLLGSVFGKTVTTLEALVLYRQHSRNVTGRQKRVRKRDVLSRLSASKRLATNDDLARLCQDRATMLDNYALRHQNEWAEAAVLGARHHRRFAALYKARGEMLTEKTLFRRFVKLTLAAARGAYRAPERAGFGRNSMVKDLIQTIVHSNAN